MGIESLSPGDKVQLSDGATAEVASGPKGETITVTVIDSPFGADQPGSKKDVDSDEIYGVFMDADLTVIRAL